MAPPNRRLIPLSAKMLYPIILSASILYRMAASLSLSPHTQLTDTMYMDLFSYAMETRIPKIAINMEKIIREYASICPYLAECDRGHVTDPPPIIYDHSEAPVSACRPCDCSYRCMVNRNCCPGSPYQYFQFQSANRIRHSDLSHPPDFVYMIGLCPQWYEDDDYVINRCMGDNSMFLPVSSITTFLTYKNKYCAACHNESKLFQWPSQGYCYSSAGRERLTSPKDVVNDKDCWIEFFPDRFLGGPVEASVRFRKSDVDDFGVGKCNVTGLWEVYDEDINWACEHLNHQYHDFKNPFCYICNPGFPSTQSHPLIDSCNLTGEWTWYKPEVEQACQSQSQTRRLFPFKNIHCLICNRDHNISYRGNANATMIEKVIPAKIHITFEINRNNSWEVLESIRDLFQAPTAYDVNPTNTEEINRIKNLSHVLNSHVSICGKWASCSVDKADILWTDVVRNCKVVDQCSCSSDCGNDKPCCPDILLKYTPLHCISLQSVPHWIKNTSSESSDPGTNRSVLIIDQCMTDANVEEYFQPPYSDDAWQNWPDIPVRSRWNTVYRNSSYLLCNMAEESGFVDVELYCSQHIDYDLYATMKDFVHTAKDYCNIYFISTATPSCKRAQTVTSRTNNRNNFPPVLNISTSMQDLITAAYISGGNDTFSRCNQTQKWEDEDRDIRSICEGDVESYMHLYEYKVNGFTYKNFACFICNPAVQARDVDHVISTCNVTGAWPKVHNEVERTALCEQTTYHKRWLPFKNYFCSECNLPPNTITRSPQAKKYSKIFFPVQALESYYKLSQIYSPFNDETTISAEDVICSRGHVFKNDSCLANYSEQEMTFLLSFSLKWSRASSGDDTACAGRDADGTYYTADLGVINDQITEQILSGLQYHDISIKPFYRNGSVDTSCNQGTQEFELTSLSTLSYSFTFGYAGTNVVGLEMLMLGFLGKAYLVNVRPNAESSSQCVIILHAFYQPQQAASSDEKLPSHLKFCRYSKELPGIHFLLPNVVIDLDRFLVCPQFEFNEEQFVFNQAADTITVVGDHVTLESGFFKWHGTAIRVCVNDYNDRLIQVPVQISHSVVTYYPSFTKITLGISLLFLALTLLACTAFHCLRKHFGKNTMVLIFCLLCTQTFQEASLHFDSNAVGCQTVLIVMHYFWLSCLFMMKLCLLHIFQLYYKANLCDKALPDNGKKQFIGYLTYAFCLPLTIMAVIVCIVILPSGGQSTDNESKMCFGSDIDANIVAFTIPAALVVSVNIIYLGFAFCVIRATRNDQTLRDTEEDFHRDLRVAVVLSITWWLYFLDPFIGLPFFSFAVQLINSLQGLFIFISYACRTKVLALFKESRHQ